MRQIFPKRSKWNTWHWGPYYYTSLFRGFQRQIVRPLIARIFCLIADHTFDDYDFCLVCGKNLRKN